MSEPCYQGKIQGIPRFLRPIQALDQLKTREIAALLDRIPYVPSLCAKRWTSIPSLAT
jgi:hypothetical protein